MMYIQEKEKAKIKVGVASYESVVKANFEDEDLIDWGTIYACGKKFTMSGVEVCELPKQFQQLGFRKTLVYDKNHFLAHKEDFWVNHGHNGNKEDMLRVSDIMMHPIAIMSTTKDSNLVEMLCLDENNDKMKYYSIILNPSFVYNNFIEPKMATMLVSFYEIEKRQVEERLNSSVNGERELIMFNNRRYNLAEIDKITELQSRESFSNTVHQYCKSKEETYQEMRFVSALISKATNNSMRKMCGERLQNQSYFNKTIESICISLKSSNNMNKIIKMREILLKVADQADEKYIQTQFKRYVEHTFAKSYIRILNRMKNSVFEQNVNSLNEIDIRSKNSDEQLYNMVDFLETHSINLQSLGINFLDESKSNSSVQKAIDASNNFQEELKDILNTTLNQRLDELAIIIKNEGINWDDADEEYTHDITT